MYSQILIFADRAAVPDEYFVAHHCPASLRSRLLDYLYAERPDLPKLHEVRDTPEVFLDVSGSVYAANRKVRVRLPRGYSVLCYLSHAHAVCAQLREGEYLTVTPKRGLPFVIVPGMFHGAVLYLDDVPRVADALAARAVEGAAFYEGLRSSVIAEGHVYDGRLPSLFEAVPDKPVSYEPRVLPPGTTVQVVAKSRPLVDTGTVLEEGWDTKGGCLVLHDDGAKFGWGWAELREVGVGQVS